MAETYYAVAVGGGVTGGGVVGVSSLFHLARLGLREVVPKPVGAYGAGAAW